MSLDIINKMASGSIGFKLAFQCAPVISGIKISNLLTIGKDFFIELPEILKGSGLSSKVVYKGKEKIVLLIYRKAELTDYLKEKEVSSFLHSIGYKSLNLNSIFGSLSLRYKEYMRFKKNFPHELGLLLGYPVGDVTAFIKNNGKNFLYCGYWKVYSNLDVKLALFRNYEKVQAEMLNLVDAGFSITDVIKICNMDRERVSLQTVCA